MLSHVLVHCHTYAPASHFPADRFSSAHRMRSHGHCRCACFSLAASCFRVVRSCRESSRRCGSPAAFRRAASGLDVSAPPDRHASAGADSSSVYSRRLQLPAGMRHIFLGTPSECDAGHVEAFRKLSYRHASHLYVHVLSRPGIALGGRETALRTSLVCRAPLRRR